MNKLKLFLQFKIKTFRRNIAEASYTGTIYENKIGLMFISVKPYDIPYSYRAIHFAGYEPHHFLNCYQHVKRGWTGRFIKQKAYVNIRHQLDRSEYWKK